MFFNWLFRRAVVKAAEPIKPLTWWERVERAAASANSWYKQPEGNALMEAQSFEEVLSTLFEETWIIQTVFRLLVVTVVVSVLFGCVVEFFGWLKRQGVLFGFANGLYYWTGLNLDWMLIWFEIDPDTGGQYDPFAPRRAKPSKAKKRSVTVKFEKLSTDSKLQVKTQQQQQQTPQTKEEPKGTTSGHPLKGRSAYGGPNLPHLLPLSAASSTFVHALPLPRPSEIVAACLAIPAVTVQEVSGGSGGSGGGVYEQGGDMSPASTAVNSPTGSTANGEEGGKMYDGGSNKLREMNEAVAIKAKATWMMDAATQQHQEMFNGKPVKRSSSSVNARDTSLKAKKVANDGDGWFPIKKRTTYPINSDPFYPELSAIPTPVAKVFNAIDSVWEFGVETAAWTVGVTTVLPARMVAKTVGKTLGGVEEYASWMGRRTAQSTRRMSVKLGNVVGGVLGTKAVSSSSPVGGNSSKKKGGVV